jgi:hypothetical protein
MVRVLTRKPKPTRTDATSKKSFQDLVEGWLVSAALARLNAHHLAGKPPLDSGNERHISRLADYMNAVADQEFDGEFNDDDPKAFPTKTRLLHWTSDNQIRRAIYVLQRWDPTRVAGRRRGGKHGAEDGVRKGPTPRWSCADLLPHWDLPARQRQAAVTAATGMSSSTFYRLQSGMDSFLERRAADDADRAASASEFAHLLKPESDQVTASYLGTSDQPLQVTASNSGTSDQPSSKFPSNLASPGGTDGDNHHTPVSLA